MKRMVITGVNGFIGRAALEYFHGQYEITGMDLAANVCNYDPKIHYYQCNMAEEGAKLSAIFADMQPDVILHCAGCASVGASVLDPLADLKGNLNSLYHLLLALLALQKKPKIIFLSSAAVYGNPRQLPIKETDVLEPISPYGIHKLMCEELCSYFNRVHDYQIRSIRIFSAYGNGLRKQLLWDIYQKYDSNGKIALFGTGNETRDFIHITDIMQAIRQILAYEGEEEIFNVANGEEIAICQAADEYARLLHQNSDIVSFNGETKIGDPQNWRADITLLKKTGYEKQMDFKKGLKMYVDWVKQQG